MTLRKFGILTVFRFSNNYSEDRMGKALDKFSTVEADSAWQLLKAIESEKDPAYRAKLFMNALEEVHHAYLFKMMANRFTKMPPGDVALTRTKLYSEDQGGIRFKIAHYLGEKNVFEQFLSYADSITNEDIKKLFLEIRGDEEEHQKQAYLYLKQEIGSAFRLRMLILKEQLVIFKNDFIRFGKVMGDIVSGLIMSVIYLLGGVLFICFYKGTVGENKKKYLDL